MSATAQKNTQYRRPQGHAALVFFLLLGVMPLAAGLVYALLYSLGLIGYLNTGFTLQYWYIALTSKALWASLTLSLGLAVLVSAVSFFLALRCVIALHPYLKQRGVRFSLHLPLALPPLVAAFVSFQWLGGTGMLARGAHAIGLIQTTDSFPVLVNDPYYIGVFVTLLLLNFPFILLLVLDQYDRAGIPEYVHLAATLGGNSAQIRRKVIQAILVHRVLPTLVLYTVFLFGAFEVPLLLGQQSPAMISVLISQKFSKFNLADVPVAYTCAVLYAGVILVLIACFWRWHFRQSLNTEPA